MTDEEPVYRRLSYPAPIREWYMTDTGGWASRAWTKEAREEYVKYGGWFSGAEDKA